MPETAETGGSEPLHAAVGRPRIPAVGTGDEQRGGLRVGCAQGFPGVEEEVEVLARLDRSGEENEAFGQVEAGADGGELRPGGGGELLSHAVPDDGRTARGFGPLVGDLARYRVRHGDDPRRLADGVLEEGQQAQSDLEGQGLGVVEDGEVVDRDDPGDREAMRQGQERRPEKVEVASGESAWQVLLLPENPQRRPVHLDRQALVGQTDRRMQGGVREPDELELALDLPVAEKLAEERFGVDADAGRAGHEGAEIDGDPRAVRPLL